MPTAENRPRIEFDHRLPCKQPCVTVMSQTEEHYAVFFLDHF